jgi:uncharacterized membrane protein/protein-disulfide isomerase
MKKTRTWLFAFSLIALAASLASLYVHYRLVKDPAYTSFCDISETVSCEAVYQSAYGSFAGVPVAAAGAIWSALVFLLAYHGMRNPRSESAASAAGYIFVLSTIGLSAVLYLGYASFFILHKMCLLCVVTYVAVLGIFVVSGAAVSLPLTSLPSRAGRDLRGLVSSPAALTLALLWLVGSASLVAFFPRESIAPSTETAQAAATPAAPVPTLTDAQRADFEKWMAAQPRVPIAVPADGAKVLIVKFNDYQCPPCKQTYLEYKGIIAKYEAAYPGQIKYVSKDFPLELECNTGGPHQASCEAAAAVRMARGKNKADALEAWLFDNQPAMSPALVRQGVSQVAGVTDFDAQYPKVLEQVRADVALGRQLSVNQTPTFFINGVRVLGGLRPQFFEAAVAYELKRSSEAPKIQ